MQYFARIALLCLLSSQVMACGSVFSWDKANEVETAKLDNVEDFMGCWYVISVIPNSIEAGAEDSIECYELGANSRIPTTFTFYRDGQFNKMQPMGRVRWDRDPDGSVWGMKFKLWGWFPMPEMAYLILDFGTVYDAGLDQDIEVSVVGGPTDDYLWIMAREPAISDELHEALKSIAAEHYNVDALEKVPHPRNLGE